METKNIPEELKLLPQWVNWKTETRGGKITKIPLNPKTLKNAQSNNPDTWGTFEKALSNYRNGIGVGIVVTEDDSYAGMDLDKCRDPETGELKPWAKDIITKVRSYTEVSPSGKGIRGIVKCTLPKGERKVGNIEIYDTGRFFTITGKTLDGYNTIKECDGSELHSFVIREAKDLQIINKAITARNGDKIKALWEGNWSGYPSQSEADIALAGHLYFYTKNVEWTDRLFRKSGLMRPKWDTRHYGDGRTYGQGVLDEIRENNTEQTRASSKTQEEWAEPIPLTDYSQLPQFPSEVLPDIGREIVETVALVNQVDTGLIGSIYLSVLATCTAKKAEVDLKTHKEPLNIFTCSVLDSGERKTSTMSIMTAPLYKYQKDKTEKMADEIRQSYNRNKINEARLAKLQKQAAYAESEVDRIKLKMEASELMKEMAEYPLIKPPLIAVDDITNEALGINMAENNERISIFSAEGGLFQIIAGLYHERGENFDIYLKGHAGDPWSSHRVGREQKHMKCPALTMCLAVQHDVIKEIGGHRSFRGRGLTARFLYSICRSQIGLRTEVPLKKQTA